MNKKLTEQEKEQLTKASKKNQQFVYSYGQLSIQKKNLKAKEDELDEAYEEFQTNVNKLMDDLEEKYGSGKIDMEKGEFIPTQEEEVEVVEEDVDYGFD